MVTAAQVFALEPYGPVDPKNIAGSIRRGHCKYGDGLFIEEATTNIVPNPAPVGGGGNIAPGAGASISYSTTRAFVGSQSVRTVVSGTDTNIMTQNFTIPATGSWTLTAHVYVESGTIATTGWSVNLEGGTATFTNTSNSAATVVQQGRWVTLTAVYNVTVAGTSNFVLHVPAGTAAGGVVYSGGFQMENKAYATSYCDGSLATAWNAPGNLLPANAQDFEDGTLGGWNGNLGSLSNSTAWAYSGTHSLLQTANGGNANQYINSPQISVTPGKVYSAQAKARTTVAGRQMYVQIDWFTAGNAYISSVTGTPIDAVSGSYLTSAASGVAPANAALATMYVVQKLASGANNTAGDTLYIDACRFSEGTEAAAYSWNGADNASTSVRAGGFVKYANPGVSDNYTVVVLYRPVYAPTIHDDQVACTTDNGQTAGWAIRRFTDGIWYLGVTGSAGQDARAQVAGVGGAAGDLYLLAFTRSGSVTTGFVSLNGAALVSASTTLAATTGTAQDLILGASQVVTGNGAVEQAIVLNVALSPSEIAAIASSMYEKKFSDDPRIVFAAACGDVRGTTKSNTTSGTGSYRAKFSVAAVNYESINPSSASADDNNSTMKISVPAGSGFGSGDLVRIGSADSGPIYTVQRVFAPGGVYDELYVA